VHEVKSLAETPTKAGSDMKLKSLHAKRLTAKIISKTEISRE
jgi:hypothetical protein